MKLKPPKKSDHPPNSDGPKKRFFGRKLEKLEVYLIAADNPVGRKQLRPIFRRKRARKVLTREQVVAIKRGRKVLRREMKEQGFKRWIDFNITAENLGLYFDHKGLLWPFFLWLMKSSTAAKVLATTAVLSTLVTVVEPVIEYVTQYVTQYVTKYVTELVDELVEVEKDRYTIHISDEMLNRGLQITETPEIEESWTEKLYAIPSWDVPCVSITQIPSDVDQQYDGKHEDTPYFAYTFYCRYIDDEGVADPDGISYDWGIRIFNEGTDPDRVEPEEEVAPIDDEESTDPTEPPPMVSDALWVMVIQDGEVMLSAKRIGLDQEGNPLPEKLPSDDKLARERVAYVDWSIAKINQRLAGIDPWLNADRITMSALQEHYGDRAQDFWNAIESVFNDMDVSDLTRLMLRREKPDDETVWYEEAETIGDRSYYQVIPECFVDEDTVMTHTRSGVQPWTENEKNMHKYTVVLWLEGDDPQCTNELMNGHIGLNFQIKGADEDFLKEITDSAPNETTDPTEEA